MRLIGIIFFILIVQSCKDRKLSHSNETGLDIKTILRQDKKMNLFYENVKEETGTYFNPVSVHKDIMIKSYYNIGLYYWNRNSNHLSHGFERYFFNYLDTVYFVQKHDTLNWNSRVNDFLKEYDDKLSEEERQKFLDQMLD